MLVPFSASCGVSAGSGDSWPSGLHDAAHMVFLCLQLGWLWDGDVGLSHELHERPTCVYNLVVGRSLGLLYMARQT